MTEKSWQKASKRLEIKLSPELHGRWTAFCEERGQASASAAIRDLMAHVVDDPKLAYWTNAKSRFDKNPAAKHKGDWALLRIEPGLMNEWRAHCHRVHERPSVHVSDLMRAQMKQQQDRELAITSYVNDLGPDRSRSRQITLRVSDTEYVVYSHLGTPVTMSDREFVADVALKLDPPRKAMSIEMRSTTDPSAPHTSFVRAELEDSVFALTSIEHGTKTHVVAEIHCDPKGSIAAWIVNLFQKSWGYNTIASLRRQVRRGSAPTEPHLETLLRGAGVVD